MTSLQESYDDFPRIEEAFKTALDESLHPRGPDMLYDIVADLALAKGARVLDLGCGEGQHSLRLAERFEVAVLGIDPVARHIELCNEALDEAAVRSPEVRERVRFERGAAESIPADDGTIDFIWCKDVITHIEEVGVALAECSRVLRPRGHMLIYHSMLARGGAVPPEVLWQYESPDYDSLGTVTANADPLRVEAAFAAAGLEIEQRIELQGEWGERDQEDRGEPGRRLLHASRLLRDPKRYIEQFGKANYDLMLADCFWHIYRMIGKITPRIYLLRKPA
jgi:SAM-dependent methyltransferase